MKKNVKILIPAIIFFFSGLFMFILSLINTGKSLPDFSEKPKFPKAIQEQITAARLKVYFLPSSNHLTDLGKAYHSCANYHEASQCYQLACRKNKNNLKAHYYLGYLDLEKGNTESAINNFRRVIQIDPSNSLAFYYLGEAFQNLNHPEEAEKYFRKIIAPDGKFNSLKPDRENYFPVSTYAKFMICRICLSTGRVAEAEKILKETVETYVTFGPAYRLLGNVYIQKGDSILSRKYTIRAKDYADFIPPVDSYTDDLLLISRSDLYLLKGIDQAINNCNFKWALKLCDHGLVYMPNNKYLLSKCIKVYLSTGRESKAFSLVEKHLALFQNDFKELFETAEYFMKNGKYKIGILYYSAAKKVNPLDAGLALWLRTWNYNQEAEILVEKQLEKKPGDLHLLSNALLISIGSKDRKNVDKYLLKINQIDPEAIDLLKSKGFIAYQDNNLEEAIAKWKEVIKKDPKDIGTIRNLNKVYKQKHEWIECSNILKIGLENSPNDPQLLDEYGKLLIFCEDKKIRNIQEGKEYAERAYFHFYGTYEIKLSAARNLATAYIMIGDKKEAIRFMNISLEMAKDSDLKDFQVYFEELKKKYANVLM